MIDRDALRLGPMLLLVQGNTRVLSTLPPRVGRLVTPRERMVSHLGDGPWAADNGAFNGFDEPLFRLMLGKILGIPGCLFVVAPDVVGHADETDRYFRIWEPALHGGGFPVAYVAQDGCATPPWDHLEALFIGGSTTFKLSAQVVGLIAEARARGKWVHIGRVNSRPRFTFAERVGAHSVDGSGFSRWHYKLAKAYAWMQQPILTGTELP